MVPMTSNTEIRNRGLGSFAVRSDRGRRQRTMASVSLVTLLVFGALGCISSPYQGILFTHSSHHVYGKQQGSQIGSANIVRKGESCSWGGFLLAPFYYGTGPSLREAMESAGISKLAVTDRRSLSILPGFVFLECVQVFGE